MKIKHIAYFAIFFLPMILLFRAPILAITGLDVIGFTSDGGGGEVTTISGEGFGGFSGEEKSVEVPSGGTSTSGGGGGGGNLLNISVEPKEIIQELAINTNIEKTISVKNNEPFPVTLAISHQGLDNMIMINETSLYLISGETKTFKTVLVALSETGLFTGKIKIGTSDVLVSLNVRTKLLLFDSSIEVLNKASKLRQGTKLKTKINLIPLGDEERLDVELKYTIKDYDGNIFLTKSETILIDQEKTFEKEFDTDDFPLGNYIIGMELFYSNGVATSSDSFEVVERIPLGALFYYLIVAILINSLLIIFILLNHWTNSKEEFYYDY